MDDYLSKKICTTLTSTSDRPLGSTPPPGRAERLLNTAHTEPPRHDTPQFQTQFYTWHSQRHLSSPRGCSSKGLLPAWGAGEAGTGNGQAAGSRRGIGLGIMVGDGGDGGGGGGGGSSSSRDQK
ncbi:hypothetical protein E2C01_076804 [Portunus trituberculatus]|uniref:Uncharacterized protein n=1 Tax=Portunus trituberculatus TaxID=210409 RepID=A0A5B7IKM1_PORTR|nr:hypothetical protein [Portunus trituberculatus]